MRLDEKTYARLRRLAGRIQAASGTRTSLCDTVRCLLNGGTAVAVRKARSRTGKRAKRRERTHSHELVPYFQRREIH